MSERGSRFVHRGRVCAAPTTAPPPPPPPCQRGQILERLSPGFHRKRDQPLQDPRGGERIRARAMPFLHFDSEIASHAVEASGPKPGYEAACELDRAEPRAIEHQASYPAQLARQESPVERGVVGDKDPSGERREHIVRDLGE